MKTTVEIADTILDQVRRLAAEEGTTLRALMEEGLRQVVKSREPGAAFVLRDASVSGRGLQPEFRDTPWEKVRDAAYEGHGA